MITQQSANLFEGLVLGIVFLLLCFFTYLRYKYSTLNK